MDLRRPPGEGTAEAVSLIPLDRILVETDAPYLTPKNVPGLGGRMFRRISVCGSGELAKYRKVTEETLMEHAKKNTERLFHLKT